MKNSKRSQESAPTGYEVTFITRGEMTDQALKNLREKLEGITRNHGGDVVHSEDWGKRKLAYPISNESRGHYSYMVFTGDNKAVAEIERNLRIQEQVMRFLTVKLGEEFDSAEFKKKLESMPPRHVAESRDYREPREPRESRGEY